MTRALIKVAYRQVIDAATEGFFAKNVLSTSYDEFLMKSQVYNLERKFKTFSELKNNDGRANSLHYKAGFAAGGLIRSLNNVIPQLKDTLGKNIKFATHQFEIIESDILNKDIHKISITYFTDTITLLDTLGEYLLLALGDQSENVSKQPVETFLLKMEPGLSIVEYREISSHAYNNFNNSFLNS